MSQAGPKGITNLGRQTQDLGRVIEALAQPDKPLVARNAADAADHQSPACACPVAVFAPLLHPPAFFFVFLDLLLFRRRDALRDQVADEVDNERADELRDVRSALLDATVGAERLNNGLQPQPARPWDRSCAVRRLLAHRRFCSITPSYYMRRKPPLRQKLQLYSISGNVSGVPRISVGNAPRARASPDGGVVYHGGRRRWFIIGPVLWAAVKEGAALWR